MIRRVFTILLVGLAVGAAACGSDDGSGSAAGGSGGTQSGGSGGTQSGGSGGTQSGGSGGTSAGGSAGAMGGFAGLGGFAGAATGGSAGAVSFGPYPSGPYGSNLGDTVADLAWEGYVNDTGAQTSDLAPYADYGTDQMRKSGKAYGLVHVSAFT